MTLTILTIIAAVLCFFGWIGRAAAAEKANRHARDLESFLKVRK